LVDHARYGSLFSHLLADPAAALARFLDPVRRPLPLAASLAAAEAEHALSVVLPRRAHGAYGPLLACPPLARLCARFALGLGVWRHWLQQTTGHNPVPGTLLPSAWPPLPDDLWADPGMRSAWSTVVTMCIA
jgi:hypothetical protein